MNSKEPDDLVDHALVSLPAAPVDPRFSERVLAVARANLVTQGVRGVRSAAPAPWGAFGLALSRAVVPALLASAAAERTVETITVAQKIYAAREPPSDTPASATKPSAR